MKLANLIKIWLKYQSNALLAHETSDFIIYDLIGLIYLSKLV